MSLWSRLKRTFNSDRLNEIGIRMAHGASATQVLEMMARGRHRTDEGTPR